MDFASELGVGSGDAGARLVIGPDHLNFLGLTHGGVVFAVAMSAARHLVGDGVETVDSHLVLTGRSAVGERLDAAARYLSRGRTLATVGAEVRRSDGRLVGLLTVSVRRSAPAASGGSMAGQ